MESNGKMKLVIVGASFGGRMVATNVLNLLGTQRENVDIVMIDKSSHFEYICGGYRNLVDDIFVQLSESNETAMDSLNNDLGAQNGKASDYKPVRFVQGMLSNVDHAKNEVHVQLPDDKGTTTFAFDALIICTGATYNSPWRSDDMQTLEARTQETTSVRDAIKNANSILVQGGGVTAVESVAYIAEKYPGKKVGIASSNKALLPHAPGAHPLLAPYLKNTLKVNIHTGAPRDLEQAKTDLGYEYVVNCTGFKFLGPAKFMHDELSKCLEPVSGQIQVNEFCQVTQVHPLAEKKDGNFKTFGNIFSLGDVCLTPRNEVKSIVSIYQYVYQTSHNIVQVLKKNAPSQRMPEHFVTFQAIPLGTKMGMTIINDKVSMGADAVGMKQEVETNFLKALRNDHDALVQGQANAVNMGKMFGFLNSGCMGCFAMGSRNGNKMRRQSQANDRIRQRLQEFQAKKNMA